MSQVSRFPLSKSLETQMFTLFRRVLADFHSESQIAEFLDDLLTPTEKIMLGKRLAIAFQLDKGFDQRSIGSIMNVSLSTVSEVNYWLKNQGIGYRRAIAMVRREERWNAFMQKLDDTFLDLFSKKKMHQLAYGRIRPKPKTSTTSLF